MEKDRENPDSRCRLKFLWLDESLSPTQAAAFRAPETLLREAKLLKNSASTTAGIFAFEKERFFIKRHNCSSLTDRLRRIGSTPRALKNRRASEAIAALGIRVPKPLMTLVCYPFALPGASYLITEFFSGPMSVLEYLPELLDQMPLDELCGRMAAIMGKLHDHGIYHGDLKLMNWLAVKKPDGEFELGLFDFDGTCCKEQPLSRSDRRRELARVVSSCASELRRQDLPESDPAELLHCWCEAYEQATGWEFQSDTRLLKRVLRFLRRTRKK